jgi:hypothetical protein
MTYGLSAWWLGRGLTTHHRKAAYYQILCRELGWILWNDINMVIFYHHCFSTLL